MLTTLVYKSRVQTEMSSSELYQLVKAAGQKNTAKGISGVLLFDGEYFLQYLEGPNKEIKSIYKTISGDTRHRSVVKLMEDHSPIRRFAVWSMYAIDVTTLHGEDLAATLSKGATFFPSHFGLPTHDRVLKIIMAFASSTWNDQDSKYESCDWELRLQPSQIRQVANSSPSSPCQFAFQPIINTKTGIVSSYEALIRSPWGDLPQNASKVYQLLHYMSLILSPSNMLLSWLLN
jgi:hypothetical protein